jgi:hypothetical protein
MASRRYFPSHLFPAARKARIACGRGGYRETSYPVVQMWVGPFEAVRLLFVRIRVTAFILAVLFSLNSTPLRASNADVRAADETPSFTREGSPIRVARADAGPNGTAIVSGFFDHIGGTARYRLAKLNNHLALDQTFDPGFVMTNFPAPRVKATSDGGAIIADGTSREFHPLIRLRSDGSQDPAYITPSIGMPTNLLTEPYFLVNTNGEVTFLGGIVDKPSSGGVFRLRVNGSLDESIQPFSSNRFIAPFQLLGIAAQGPKFIVLGNTRTNQDGIPANRLVLVRLNYDLTVDESFTSVVFGRSYFFGSPFLFVERNQRIIVGSDRFTPDGAYDVRFEETPYSEYGYSISLPDNRFLTPAGELLDANGKLLKQVPLPGELLTLLSDDNTILCGQGYIRLRPVGPTTLEISSGALPNLQIVVSGEPNQLARLEMSLDLSNWTEIDEGSGIQSPTITFTNIAQFANAFFRVRVQGLTE